MVEIGSMQIGGSIDTSLIERGFRRIGQGFGRVKASAKSFGSDMVRIGQSVGGLVKGLGILSGAAGIGTIIGMAKYSPAVATSMAKIGVEFQKLSRILGEQLSPYFEAFSDMFTKFVGFVADNPDLTKGFVLTAGAIAGVAAMTKLVGLLTGGTVAASILIALGYLAAIAGAAYVVKEVVEKVSGKSRGFLIEEAEQIPGTLQSLASVDESAADIAARGFQPTPGGMISEWTEPSRKMFLLRWWDALFG